MATRTQRVCDVHETYKNVEAVQVLVLQMDLENDTVPLGLTTDQEKEAWETVLDKAHLLVNRCRDLGPKGIDRLKKAIDFGTNPPGWKVGDATPDAPDDEQMMLGDGDDPPEQVDAQPEPPAPKPKQTSKKKTKKRAAKKS